jgi:hypothetical protein
LKLDKIELLSAHWTLRAAAGFVGSGQRLSSRSPGPDRGRRRIDPEMPSSKAQRRNVIRLASCMRALETWIAAIERARPAGPGLYLT